MPQPRPEILPMVFGVEISGRKELMKVSLSMNAALLMMISAIAKATWPGPARERAIVPTAHTTAVMTR